MFYDENSDFGIDREEYIDAFRYNLNSIANAVQEVGGQVNHNMARHLYEFSNQYEYAYMAYVRGMLLFVDLENMLGRDVMKRGLAHLARTNMFGIIGKQCLVASFEHVSGQRLDLFFDGFVSGENFVVFVPRSQRVVYLEFGFEFFPLVNKRFLL